MQGGKAALGLRESGLWNQLAYGSETAVLWLSAVWPEPAGRRLDQSESGGIDSRGWEGCGRAAEEPGKLQRALH